ncbi:MAG: hypothetical protein ACI8Y4_004304 [Candidatus Poriferisodalaceae bacterium]
MLIRELPRPGKLADGVIATGVPDEVLSVVDVPADDMLNLRTGPGTEFEIVGELSPNATGIIAPGFGATASNGSLWVWVVWPGLESDEPLVGWAYTGYLSAEG